MRAKQQEIAAYASSHLQLASNKQSCPLKVTQHLIDQHTDGAYAVLRFAAQCAQPVQTLQASYSLLFDVDPQHKGLLRLQFEKHTISGIFSPEKTRQEFNLQQVGLNIGNCVYAGPFLGLIGGASFRFGIAAVLIGNQFLSSFGQKSVHCCDKTGPHHGQYFASLGKQ